MITVPSRGRLKYSASSAVRGRESAGGVSADDGEADTVSHTDVITTLMVLGDCIPARRPAHRPTVLQAREKHSPLHEHNPLGVAVQVCVDTEDRACIIEGETGEVLAVDQQRVSLSRRRAR